MIAVAFSGGADSLMTLLLLQEQGHQFFALHANFLAPDLIQNKYLYDLCHSLNINLQFVDLQTEFKQLVIKPFISDYIAGKTPNPCAHCNRHIKFGLLQQKVRKLGATSLATGHYARLQGSGTKRGLYTARDKSKDQSYFLSLVAQPSLQDILLPLGDKYKKDIILDLQQRGITPQAGKESQEICFIPDDYKQFLLKQSIKLPGPGLICTLQGKKLGEHEGLWRYTLGQRKGLGIAYSHPLYVVDKNETENILFVGSKKELLVDDCEVGRMNYLVPIKDWPFQVLVKTRYRQNAVEANIETIYSPEHVEDRHHRATTGGCPYSNDAKNTEAEGNDPPDRLQIKFINKHERPTPGQVAAFYSEQGQILGGGVINQ